MLHITCKTLRVSVFNKELLYCTAVRPPLEIRHGDHIGDFILGELFHVTCTGAPIVMFTSNVVCDIYMYIYSLLL